MEESLKSPDDRPLVSVNSTKSLTNVNSAIQRIDDKNGPVSLQDILKNAQYMKLPPITQHNDFIEKRKRSSKNISAQLNNNSKLFIPPPNSQKTHFTPKVFSSILSIKVGTPPKVISELDCGIKDVVSYRTLDPRSTNYDQVSILTSPYISLILIALMSELDHHVPRIRRIVNGTNKKDIEECDIFFNTLLNFKINDEVSDNAYNTFFRHVSHNLTYTLIIFLQRTKFPLSTQTIEFGEVILSNKYSIKYVPFGCIDLDEQDPFMTELMKSLSFSSSFQVPNLAFFIQRCQRWIRSNIYYELKKKPTASTATIYEESVAAIAVLFGQSIVGIPHNYVTFKSMDQSLPLLSEIRNTIFYLLIGIPPFEFWHTWSKQSNCFENDESKPSTNTITFMNHESSDELSGSITFL